MPQHSDLFKSLVSFSLFLLANLWFLTPVHAQGCGRSLVAEAKELWRKNYKYTKRTKFQPDLRDLGTM